MFILFFFSVFKEIQENSRIQKNESKNPQNPTIRREILANLPDISVCVYKSLNEFTQCLHLQV